MAPNPYETTQNNFSGTSTNPGGQNIYESTQGNFSGTGGGGGGQNIYESTQGNFSGTGGGYTGPSMADIQDMMNTTMGNYKPPVYSGPSLEDFGSMMDNKLAGYMTPDQVQAMMSGTMGGGGGYEGPSLSDIQSMMESTLGGYATTADVESLMSGTMGSNPPPVVSGPSMADIQDMMNTTMGNFSANLDTGPSMADIQNMMNTTLGNFSSNLDTGPSMADIESLMESTMGNYMTPEQVQAMMESTMGASEPGSVSSTVNVDLGGDTPGLSPTELENLMQSTMGISMADFVSGGNDPADMDADGDGKVTQAELDAYAGNVYSYDAPDNQFGDSVTDLNQSVIDMLNDPFGENGIPAIANFMDDLSIRQDQADADLEQNLVNRGITDSSIADNMRMQHERNQTNERAMLQTNLMQNVIPLYSQTGMGYEQLTDADRQQSLGDFFQFLDRQVAENRWTDQQAAQGLSLMLNALGMGTINPSMPAFNIPAGQPGAGQSIGNLLGNLGTAWLGAGGGQSWLGG